MADEVFEIGDGIDQTACHQCGNVVDVSDAASFSVVTCSHCQAKLTVPARLGEFLLLKVLGKGTMGAAYKAYDRALGRQVAIKVMRKSLGEDQTLVERFLGEARALASLNHRNVVQIYSLGKEKGRPYIVMELAPGGGLREQMRADRQLPEAEVLSIGRQIAEGLQAAHGIGLIHGDVKPANILFGEDGVAKLVDFGLARFGGVRQEPGEGLGTPYYVAPERVRQEGTDHRADIYSLGATLFHALTGEPPFEAETVKGVLTARLKGPAPDARSMRPDVGAKTAVMLAKMLAAEPPDRYQTYEELLADLRGAAPGSVAPDGSILVQAAPVPLNGSLRVGAAASGATRPRPVLSRQGARELNVVFLCLLAGVMLLIIGGVVFAWWMMSNESDTPTLIDEPSRDEPQPWMPPPVGPVIPDPTDPLSSPTVSGHDDPPAIQITLKAADAEIQGEGARYEPEPDKQCIGFWHSKDVAVGWQFELNGTGDYFVDLTYACKSDNGGGRFTVEIGDHTLSEQVTATGEWTDFKTVRLGKVRLADPGLYYVVVKGTPKPRKPLMNLRALTLVPAE